MSEAPYEAPQRYVEPGIPPEFAKIERQIQLRAMGSLIIGIISFFIVCFGIILAPVAIYHGGKVLKLIEHYNVGHRHAGTAKVGKIVGIISLALNLIGLAVWALFMYAELVVNP